MRSVQGSAIFLGILHCVTSLKTADLIYTAKVEWDHSIIFQIFHCIFTDVLRCTEQCLRPCGTPPLYSVVPSSKPNFSILNLVWDFSCTSFPIGNKTDNHPVTMFGIYTCYRYTYVDNKTIYCRRMRRTAVTLTAWVAYVPANVVLLGKLSKIFCCIATSTVFNWLPLFSFFQLRTIPTWIVWTTPKNMGHDKNIEFSRTHKTQSHCSPMYS